MKITLQQFQQAVAVHVGEAIVPNVGNPMVQWFLAGLTATGAFVNPRVTAAMQMAGILGEDGMVDVDKLDAFSKAAFKAQPRVDTPFAISFEQSDADAFISRLRRC